MNLDVVIVAYNSASRLPTVLDLLPRDLQVTVVDNASSDASAEVAETHPRGATVVRGSVNAGFAAGCNRGAALGHAKTILFLNPDALIEPDALERLVDVFYDDPQIGVAAPRLVYAKGNRQRVQWPYPSAAGAWREALGLHDHVEESAEGFVIGACLAVRREAFEAVGGFDERFWLYGEEADLCRRIEDVGWTVRRIPSAAATHVGGASAGDDPADNEVVFEHFIRGGEHFVDKHGGRGALASYRVANLVGSVGRGVLGVGRRSAEHRRRAVRLARTSLQAPTRVALDSPATAASGKGLVVCSLEAWDEVWRRNQFFVRELLAADPDLRVLFVEPAYDVVHERRRSSGREHARGLRPVEADGRIVRFEPVKWVPRKFGKVADDWRDAQVLDAVRQLGFVEPRLWVNDPSYATLADRVDWPAVYDITDDWTEVADAAEASKAQEWEARLFERCEAVTVCSLGLLESRKPLRGDLTLVPNAVDVADMQRPRSRPGDLPAGPTAVYVGTLHTDRLDVDLTGRLAKELPDVSVVLVGPDALDDDSRRQLDRAGVVRVGPKPYAEVPGYLQHADVVIVPHVVSPFTESLDPIKLYECLAVGTPTVATPIAGFRDAGGPVRTAVPSEFVEAVGDVLAVGAELTQEVVPSWRERADAFAGVLERARAAVPVAPLQVLRIYHSGVVTAWRERERLLRDAGVDLELVSASRWNEAGKVVDLVPRPGESITPARVVGSHPFLFAYDPRPLWRALRGRRWDVLDVHEEPAALATAEVLTLARLAGVRAPILLYSAQNIPKRYPVPFRWFERRALERAAAVYSCNSQVEQILRDKGFEGRVANMGIGVDLTVFNPRDAGVDISAGTLDPRPFQVGYVGRLLEEKGIFTLLDAIGMLDGVEVTFVGSGPWRDALAAAVRDHGLTERVHLAGFAAHDDVAELYAGFDVLVVPSIDQPSWKEQFGRVAVEAMACGVPVITSDGGALPEVVGDAAVVVPQGDAAALAEAISGLRDSPEARERLRSVGPERAAVFSWPVVVDAQHELYSHIAVGREGAK